MITSWKIQDRPAVIHCGKGEVTITTGHLNDSPVLIIAPAKFPGEVGASAERECRPKDALLGDELIFTFPTHEQARRVADAFCNNQSPAKQEGF